MFAWRLSSASTLLLLRREDYFELVEKIERLEAKAERLKERVKGLEKENAKFKSFSLASASIFLTSVSICSCVRLAESDALALTLVPSSTTTPTFTNPALSAQP